jgi:hypothetical protein
VGFVSQLDERWPGVALDPLMRLRVIGASLPGVVFEERTLPVPFSDVWSFIADLERSVPLFDPLVRSIRILDRSPNGDPLRLRAWPSPFRFRVELTEGLCVMHSAVYTVVLAAQPLGPDATRLGHLEGLPTSGPRIMRALERPVVAGLRWFHRRSVRRDLDGIERCLRASHEER